MDAHDRGGSSPFCCACGLSGNGPICPCGSEVRPVRARATSIGSTFMVRKGLRRREALVLAENSETALVLFPGNEEVTIPLAKLRKSPIAFDQSAIPSPLFRLHMLTDHPDWAGSLRLRLAQETKALTVQPDEARLFALSAIAAGAAHLIKRCGLTATEIAWLKMHAAAFADDWTRALDLAVGFEADTYPDRGAVIVRALANLEPADLSSEALDAISALSPGLEGSQLARALIGDLPLESMPDALDQVARFGNLDDANRKRLEWLADPTAPPAQISYDNPTLEWALTMPGGPGVSIRLERLAQIAHDSESLADDLIDQGSHISDASTATEPVELYLVARANVDDLDTHQLETIGHEWELARRAYSKTGDATLDTLAEGPAADHYRALDALRNGDTTSGENLHHPDGPLLATVTTLSTGILNDDALQDPTTWPIIGELITADAAARFPEAGAQWNLQDAYAALHQWDWDQASSRARAVLKYADTEVLRDEALNVMAFCLYQNSEDDAAIQALEKALEGDYSANLQANIGIVAEHLNPEAAARHLGELADEAPTTELRLAAVRRAFGIWNTNRPVWEEDDDEVELPDRLRSVLRRVATEGTNPEDHREIIKILANTDSTWLSDTANTSRSPHADTWDHKVYVARASSDPTKFIDALTEAIKAKPNESWIVEERDMFVEAMSRLIFDSPESVGPAMWAFAAIDRGLPMEPREQVILTAGALFQIFRQLVSEESLPADRLLTHLNTAISLHHGLDADDKEQLRPLIHMAFNGYATAVGVAAEKMTLEIAKAADELANQISYVPYGQRINWTAVRSSTSQLASAVDEAIGYIDTALSNAYSDDLREQLLGARENALKLRTSIQGMGSRW